MKKDFTFTTEVVLSKCVALAKKEQIAVDFISKLAVKKIEDSRFLIATFNDDVSIKLCYMRDTENNKHLSINDDVFYSSTRFVSRHQNDDCNVHFYSVAYDERVLNCIVRCIVDYCKASSTDAKSAKKHDDKFLKAYRKQYAIKNESELLKALDAIKDTLNASAKLRKCDLAYQNDTARLQ